MYLSPSLLTTTTKNVGRRVVTASTSTQRRGLVGRSLASGINSWLNHCSSDHVSLEGFQRRKYSITATPLPPILPPPNPPNTTSSSSSNEAAEARPSAVGKLWNRYSLKGQQHRIHTAEAFFQAATRQASDPRWFGPGHIGRDFRPRHALLTLHIWLLHKRLISDHDDPETALMIQEELFNILWDDTTCRIRQQGISEMLVNKHLLQVQQYTFLNLTHYDHAYTEFLDRPLERLKELRKIVWQHILVRDKDAELRHDQLDRIAWYIDANYQNIMLDWPDEYYRQARVAWVDLPDFSNMKDASGEDMPENPIHPDDILPKPWLRNITMRGVEYYWNPETMVSSWERPTENNDSSAASENPAVNAS